MALKVFYLCTALVITTSTSKLEAIENDPSCESGTKDTTFSREYTGVFFDPYVVFQDQKDPSYYDPEGLALLLRKVNTKFNHIMIGFTDNVEYYTQNPILVPKVAAQINKELANPERKLLMTIRFTSKFGYYGQNITSDASKINFEERVLELKSVLDEANSIYPGIIHQIIYEPLQEQQWFLEPYAFGYKIFRQIFQNHSKFDYEFGLNLNVKSCTPSTWSDYAKFFLLPPHTIYYTGFQDYNKDVTVESATENMLEEFESCRLLYTNLPVSFLTSWPDTDKYGNVRFNDTAYFWSAVDNWSREKNTLVFIFNAFDVLNLFPLFGRTKTSGWWKVVPNSSYVHPSQFQFEEKRCLKNPSQVSPEMINISYLKKPLIFNKNVGAYLNLDLMRYYTKEFNPCDTVCLRHLLSWVFTSFSILLVENPKNASDIAYAIANNNAIGENITELMFFIKSANIMEINDVAYRTNSINNGTVKSFVYKFNEWSLDNQSGSWLVSNGADKLRRIRSVMEQNELNFKLAFEINQDNLLVSNRFRLLIETGVLNLIDMILAVALVPWDDVKQDIKQLVLKYTTMFEVCIKLVQNYNKNIDVGIVTGWNDKGQVESLEELLPLIEFWEAINIWAGANNVKVIMFRGLDRLLDKNIVGRSGWWRFVENGSVPETADKLLYKNKKEIALNLATEWLDSLPKADEPGLFASWTEIVVFLIFGLITVITVAMTMAYFKLRTAKKVTDDFVKGTGRETIIGIGMERSIAEFDWSYDKSLYEIPKSSFTINNDNDLGSGQFGIVCEATVEQKGVVVKAAVKMVKSGFSDMALKGVLSEIKLMTYLGKHTNVVELLGAYTSELKRRKAYIFLEICELGSLELYLKEQTLEDLTPNLLKWAYEISSGMEYIASMRIVHLDLATRNVLLKSDKVAKIADFGLSRRLHNYDLYAKTKQEPLPWRWMPIESLVRLEFSEKSDVWAFGVTLWEIFSFGEVPYKYDVWGPQFVNKLEQGTRLERPAYCGQNGNDVFPLMQSCWDANKANRPAFSFLKNELSNFTS